MSRETSDRFWKYAELIGNGEEAFVVGECRLLVEVLSNSASDRDVPAARSGIAKLARASREPFNRELREMADELALMEAASEASARYRREEYEVGSVVRKVLTYVRAANRPVRPTEVEEALGIHLSQVSRAIARLVASDDLVLVDAPDSRSDRRGRWYVHARRDEDLVSSSRDLERVRVS